MSSVSNFLFRVTGSAPAASGNRAHPRGEVWKKPRGTEEGGASALGGRKEGGRKEEGGPGRGVRS